VVTSRLIIGSWFTVFILTVSLLVVAHPAPAVDRRLCLQLATYPHRTMFHHVYCTVQISVYYFLSVRTLEQTPLNPSIFVNFSTQRTRFRCICLINRLNLYAVFLCDVLDAVYYWRIVPEVRIPFIAFVLSYALWIANVYFSYTFIVEGFYDFPS